MCSFDIWAILVNFSQKLYTHEDSLQIVWRQALQTKLFQSRTNYLRHDQFYFEFSGTFLIVKNNCLQYYVNVLNKNIY